LENPLHHFELHTIIPLELLGIDISINQAVVMMWLVCAAVFLFFWVAGRSGRLIPNKFQSVVEVGVEFLREMILDNMGKKGMRFFPFIATLFFFILFSNLLGLIPGAYTVTSQVMVNGLLALVVFVVSVVAGIVLHGFHYLSILVPGGTPWWLMPVMIPVELISQLARPMTLAVRLFANMTAGHTVINVLLGMVLMGGIFLGWLPLGFTVLIYGLEVLIAFIQAYIFTVLTTVYIGDAIRLQH
jgi:F-type H+-transporting ATPase subunit a